MNRFVVSFHLLVPFALAVLIGACGSADDSSRTNAVPPPDSTHQARVGGFVTRTDTVTTRGAARREDALASINAAGHFMVQIGSYATQKNARNAQALARKRCKLPVVNEYNSAKRRYQIRVGFFDTEEAADTFRSKLLQDYPQEYRGAWIVRMNK